MKGLSENIGRAVTNPLFTWSSLHLSVCGGLHPPQIRHLSQTRVQLDYDKPSLFYFPAVPVYFTLRAPVFRRPPPQIL